MALLRTGPLPDEPLAAAARFHAEVMPGVWDELARAAGHLTLIFPAADYTHRGWRLAAVQSLARECAPIRINALSGDDELAIAAACAYLDGADGVTGQLLPIDGHGAGKGVIGTA